MRPEHKNKPKQLKLRFGGLSQPPAWKQSGPILKGKG